MVDVFPLGSSDDWAYLSAPEPFTAICGMAPRPQYRHRKMICCMCDSSIQFAAFWCWFGCRFEIPTTCIVKSGASSREDWDSPRKIPSSCGHIMFQYHPLMHDESIWGWQCCWCIFAFSFFLCKTKYSNVCVELDRKTILWGQILRNVIQTLEMLHLHLLSL